MFNLTIKTDNAAFQEGQPADEVARILREIAGKLEEGDSNGPAFDSNGNTVGTFTLT